MKNTLALYLLLFSPFTHPMQLFFPAKSSSWNLFAPKKEKHSYTTTGICIGAGLVLATGGYVLYRLSRTKRQRSKTQPQRRLQTGASLIEAIRSNKVGDITRFIRQGGNVGGTFLVSEHKTPIQLAFEYGHTNIVNKIARKLIENANSKCSICFERKELCVMECCSSLTCKPCLLRWRKSHNTCFYCKKYNRRGLEIQQSTFFNYY